MYKLQISVAQLQKTLAQKGFYSGKIDCLEGKNTIQAYIMALTTAGIVVNGWSNERLRIGYAQLLLSTHKLDVGTIDGYLGPQTDYAQGLYLTGSDDLPHYSDNAPYEPKSIWPYERDMVEFYGPISSNQVALKLPYKMFLSWAPTKIVHEFYIHEKLHDSALRVFKKIQEHYSPEQISNIGLDKFSGCLNPRRKRGGASWSIHSWGAAIDFDDVRNQLKWDRTRARLARPDAEPFWKFWEEEGWVSLGRARNYDWMHVQAARI